MNLAVSDLIMLAKVPVVVYNSIRLGPAAGDLICRLYGFLGGLTGTVSIITLTVVSVDRYSAIVLSHKPHRKHHIIIIIFIWIYSFIFAISPALDIGLSRYVPEGYLTSCSFDYLDKSNLARVFMFTFFVFAWLIPFSTILFCYAGIFKAVRNSENIRSNRNKKLTEYQLAKTILKLIGLWFLAWTPYATVALLGISGNEQYITPFGSMVPAIFCKTAACIDPYWYALNSKNFKKEMRRIFLGYQDPSSQSTRVIHMRRTTTRTCIDKY